MGDDTTDGDWDLICGLGADDFTGVDDGADIAEPAHEPSIFTSFDGPAWLQLQHEGSVLGSALSDRPMNLQQCNALLHNMLEHQDPSIFNLVCKQHLAVNCRTHAPPGAPPFVPPTLVLPDDLRLVEKQIEIEDDKRLWILKQCGGRGGISIFVERGLRTALQRLLRHYKSKISRWVLQPYIKPLLLDGFKWDFRLYVFATSLSPPKAFLHAYGLARFCTHRYNTAELGDRFAHLTNVAINKNGTNSTDELPFVPAEHVWAKLGELGVDVGSAQERVRTVIRSALLCVHKQIQVTVQKRAQAQSAGAGTDGSQHRHPHISAIRFSHPIANICYAEHVKGIRGVGIAGPQKVGEAEEKRTTAVPWGGR